MVEESRSEGLLYNLYGLSMKHGGKIDVKRMDPRTHTVLGGLLPSWFEMEVF